MYNMYYSKVAMYNATTSTPRLHIVYWYVYSKAIIYMYLYYLC